MATIVFLDGRVIFEFDTSAGSWEGDIGICH